MHRETDETVVISSLDRHLHEMQQFDLSDPAFGIQDVLKIDDSAASVTELMLELLKYHFSTQCRSRPDLTFEEYFELFPRHRQWENQFRVSQEVTQLQTRAWSGSQILDPQHNAVVREFSHSPLARLPAALQLELRSLMTVQSYERGDMILREGTQGDRLSVVLSGMIQIVSDCPGKPQTALGSLVVGDVLGEMSLVGSRPCTASAIAKGHVRVLSLAADDFHRLRDLHPELAQVITEIVADRLGNEQLDALSDKSLNGYLIRRRLGRGGMSIVYEAIHQPTSQRVALKMMSHRLVYDDRSQKLFDSEARIVSSFEHPNIPRIYERFDDFGTSFMAIEFVEGVPLTQLINLSNPVPEEHLLTILGQIASALEHAHHAGVVHRDVKPANCLLRRDGNVKLMDFGLSIQVIQEKQHCRSIMGTLAYMAPEQLAGDPPRPASDWFSLGLVVVELATGKRLLNPRSTSFLAGMYQNWDPEQYASSIRSPILKDFVCNSLQLNPASRCIEIDRLMEYCSPGAGEALANYYALINPASAMI